MKYAKLAYYARSVFISVWRIGEPWWGPLPKGVGDPGEMSDANKVKMIGFRMRHSP